jgi:hypothetical protein
MKKVDFVDRILAGYSKMLSFLVAAQVNVCYTVISKRGGDGSESN